MELKIRDSAVVHFQVRGRPRPSTLIARELGSQVHFPVAILNRLGVIRQEWRSGSGASATISIAAKARILLVFAFMTSSHEV